MAAPKVSIIIPTYKHRDFILATLDSVFQQTASDYEVIVVNDGSPDDTRDILKTLADGHRINYLEQPNQGQSRARNRGLAEARGEYIAFLDDDDLWPVDKLEWQTKVLDEDADIGIVAGRFQTIDERGVPGWWGPFHREITFETLFVENPFHSPGQTLIRAGLLKELGGMNASIWGADDWDLWFRIARNHRIVMYDRLALYYRLHPGNASKQTARLLSACCATIEHHLQFVDPSRREALRIRSQRTIYNGLGTLLVASAREGLLRGRPVQGIKALGGLLPLRRGIVRDAQVRTRFLREMVRG